MAAFPMSLRVSPLLAGVGLVLAGCGGGVDNDPVGFVGGGADMPHPRDYPDPRHRRLEISGRRRLERGRRQRRQIRLDQGDRGRRPRRRQVPGQLGRRQGGRHPARRLSFRLLVPARRSRRCAGSSRTCRSRPMRCRRCSTSRRRRTRKTCHRHLEPRRDHRRHAGDAGGDGAPFRQAPVDLHDASISIEAILSRRRLLRLPDVGALDQVPPVGALRLPPWMFWQYQSDGAMPGIIGEVDRNAFYGNSRPMAGVSRRTEIGRGPQNEIPVRERGISGACGAKMSASSPTVRSVD